MKKTRLNKFLSAFCPLIFVIAYSTVIYTTLYDYDLLGTFASYPTLRTLLPGFLAMFFSVSMIASSNARIILTLIVLGCNLALIYFLRNGTFFEANLIMSLLYLVLGTYIGYKVLVDYRCENCPDKT